MMIFVVGSSRSGTTMMGRILGSHPEVSTFHELHFFEGLWDGESEVRLDAGEGVWLASKLIATQRQGYLNNPDPRRHLREAEEIVNGGACTAPKIFGCFLLYEAQRMGGRIPCDQTPRNVFYIGEILRHYPTARVVMMVRDPRDVMLSQKKKWRRRYLGGTSIPFREAVRSWVNYHPVIVSRLWVAAVRAGSRWSSDPRVATVRFEDLLAQPEQTLRPLCAFLGLDFEPKMLRVPVKGSSSGRDTPGRRGIDAGRAQAWRRGGLAPGELRICERVAGVSMGRYGYEPEVQEASRIGVAVGYGTVPLKFGIALLLNLGRMRSLIRAIKRRLA